MLIMAVWTVPEQCGLIKLAGLTRCTRPRVAASVEIGTHPNNLCGSLSLLSGLWTGLYWRSLC